MGEFAIPWDMPLRELAVIAVLLILTLLLGGVDWVPVTLLAWEETLLAGAWSAPSWTSTPVGKLRVVIRPLLLVCGVRSQGALRLLSGLSGVDFLLARRASRTLSRWVIGLLISARWLLALDVWGDLARCPEHWS